MEKAYAVGVSSMQKSAVYVHGTVITSYSIHYTKLYDSSESKGVDW